MDWNNIRHIKNGVLTVLCVLILLPGCASNLQNDSYQIAKGTSEGIITGTIQGIEKQVTEAALTTPVASNANRDVLISLQENIKALSLQAAQTDSGALVTELKKLNVLIEAVLTEQKNTIHSLNTMFPEDMTAEEVFAHLNTLMSEENKRLNAIVEHQVRNVFDALHRLLGEAKLALEEILFSSVFALALLIALLWLPPFLLGLKLGRGSSAQ